MPNPRSPLLQPSRFHRPARASSLDHARALRNGPLLPRRVAALDPKLPPLVPGGLGASSCPAECRIMHLIAKRRSKRARIRTCACDREVVAPITVCKSFRGRPSASVCIILRAPGLCRPGAGGVMCISRNKSAFDSCANAVEPAIAVGRIGLPALQSLAILLTPSSFVETPLNLCEL